MANEEHKVPPLNLVVPARINPTLLREQCESLTYIQTEYKDKPTSYNYLEGVINMMNAMLDKVDDGNFYAPTEGLSDEFIDASPLDTLALKHHGLIDNTEAEMLMKSEELPEQRFPEDVPYTNEEEPAPPLDAYMHEPGAKDDETKPMAALVLSGFSGALQEVIKVGTFGAQKYSPNSWMHVPNAPDRYQNAAMRHWLKCMDGEILNPDDGFVRHMAQVCWNMLAVLEFQLAEEQIHQVESEFGDPS